MTKPYGHDHEPTPGSEAREDVNTMKHLFQAAGPRLPVSPDRTARVQQAVSDHW